MLVKEMMDLKPYLSKEDQILVFWQHFAISEPSLFLFADIPATMNQKGNKKIYICEN